MYGYGDYFDETLIKKAYKNVGESLDEYVKLAELILEDYAGLKGLGTEEGLFSRGLLISEEEMKEYFVNHPALRDKDAYFYIMGDMVEQALYHIKSREEATEDKKILPFCNIRESFGLTDPMLVALTFAYLSHKSRGYERIFGFLQDDIDSTEPTIGLVLSVCSRVFSVNVPSPYDFISEKSGLFGSLFMSEGLDETYPLRSRLILTRAALAYIDGKNSVSDTEQKILNITDMENEPEFFDEETKAVTALLNNKDRLSCIYFEGKDEAAVTHIISKAAEKCKKTLCTFSLSKIKDAEADDIAEAEEMLAFFGRMEGIFVLISEVDEDAVNDALLLKLINRFIKINEISPILLSGSEKTPDMLKTGRALGEPVLHIAVKAPDVKVRTSLWDYFMKEEKLSKEKGFSSEDLADCYEIGYKDIKASVKQAKINMLVNGLKKVDKDVMVEALKGIGTVNFNGLAKEVKTVYTWDDLCIGKEESRILKTACDRYKIKNRIGESWGITKKNAYGNGVSVLLYGPPGTGKTMSAQVVAREIGLPLYRVDTSQLFSKYIGETQKNLNAVFDEAETSNVILFFDEADALFSKRTDVESSNDRHANQEIAFLLQRIEEYKGMSILATNYYSGFDKAFVRRITYAVRLEQPDYETRLLLWENTLPSTVPTEKDIDYEFLAESFELTGSNIKAILLSAAYMAGAEDKKLSMSYIVRAMKYEFDKLGMMPDSGKFGQYAVYLYG